MTPGAAALRQQPCMNPATEPNKTVRHRPARERRLPHPGMPVKREDRRLSSTVSVLLHLLVIFLLTMPAAIHTGDVKEIAQGAGGPGPAGGGGGGHNGSGGVREHVQFVQVAP